MRFRSDQPQAYYKLLMSSKTPIPEIMNARRSLQELDKLDPETQPSGLLQKEPARPSAGPVSAIDDGISGDEAPPGPAEDVGPGVSGDEAGQRGGSIGRGASAQ